VTAITVAAIVADQPARALFAKVVRDDRLIITGDVAEAVAVCEENQPDVAFVEIGMHDGAGLALVHHLKAVVPSITVYALSSRDALEAAANAVALGGAGVIMMPLAGDDVLSAISAVKGKLADLALRTDLDRARQRETRMAAWMAVAADLAGSPSCAAAAERFVEVLAQVTGSASAVYLAGADRPAELSRAAAGAALELAPLMGMEPEILDFARRELLAVLPLAARSVRAGQILLAPPQSAALAGAELDAMLRLLAAQAAVAFALFAERERTGGAAIKDPASSAYSFAYYVDVAGREIDKARRYGRRFSIATVAFDREAPPPLSHAEMADQLLKAARDTDILAQVDEHEFHLLMPESDGLTAQAARRRVLSRLTDRGVLPRGLQVGVSTFPHDGQNLSQLLRVARRRAEATRWSLVRKLTPDQTSLVDLLDALSFELEIPPPSAVSAARPLDLPITDAVALATAVAADAIRGGSTVIVVAHHERLSLGAAVRASLGAPREGVTVHAIDVRNAPSGETLEALAVIAEHGSYALLGRIEGGSVHGLHAADPLLTDLLAERLGRAAGLRLFS
jgi:DNA-binding NarL/FixJ family response regulator